MNTKPALWGVLNVTPDSFSDGGAFTELSQAVRHAKNLIESGADVIDVGGESTRPGATRVSPEEEQRRVLPVIEALVSAGIPTSIDTMNASSAAAAIELGVSCVNDVSGGLGDPDMLGVVSEASVDYVIMHWRGPSEVMDSLATYQDVVGDVCTELAARLGCANAAGIKPERIIVDPGLGFAKTAAQNWEILAGLEHIVALGHRVLLGASRKRFLGELLSPDYSAQDRDGISATLGVLLADRGVWALRVHNPRVHREALQVWQSLGQGVGHG